MRARKVDAIIRIRPDFARTLSLGNAEVQVLVHGIDANQARIIQGYAQRRDRPVGRAAQRPRINVAGGPVVVQSRLWFNEANESRYFLVPGLIVLIMTLIGALLTALVMAREWERGTLRGVVRHTGAHRRDSSGQDDSLFCPRLGRLGPLSARRQVSVSRAVSRFADRADRRPRCFTCWWPSASAC